MKTKGTTQLVAGIIVGGIIAAGLLIASQDASALVPRWENDPRPQIFCPWCPPPEKPSSLEPGPRWITPLEVRARLAHYLTPHPQQVTQ